MRQKWFLTRGGLSFVACTLALLCGQSALPAAAAPRVNGDGVAPSVSVSPATGPPGTSVTASGGGYTPGEQVKVKYKTGLASPDPSAVGICSATSESDGTFACGGDIPLSGEAGIGGNHTILAVGKTSGYEAKTDFTLVIPPSVSAYPATGLLGKQSVHVTGSRWPLGKVDVWECSTPSLQGSCTKVGHAQAGTNGTWMMNYPALIGQVGSSGLCGEFSNRGPCYVEVSQGLTTAGVPLSFKTWVVTINGFSGTGGDWLDGTPVTVGVANFPEHDPVIFETCGYETNDCGNMQSVTTGGTGSATFTNYLLNCIDFDIQGQCNLLAIDTSYANGSVVAALPFETYGMLTTERR